MFPKCAQRESIWGAYRETALTRPVSRVGLGNVASLGNATHGSAFARVVFGVHVSGTLPQRGSLCSPNRVFQRDSGNCTRGFAAANALPRPAPKRSLSVRSSEMISERCSREISLLNSSFLS
jgi:hypothetical protein